MGPVAIAEIGNQVDSLSKQVSASLRELGVESESIVNEITTLSKNGGGYLDLVKQQANNGNVSAINEAIALYESRVAEAHSRVEQLTAAWGENNAKVKEASDAVTKYNQDMSQLIATRMQTEAQRQIDTINSSITKRENQGSGYTPEFATQLENARLKAQALIDELNSLDSSKAFDPSAVKKWSQAIEEGRKVIKQINDQDKLLATEQGLAKLQRKVNKDISGGGLKGSLAEEYNNLRSSIEGAINAIKEATDAQEALSKVDLGKLQTQYENAHAKMIQFGQDADGFGKKFATAINNQSAQFLATYFSFQDIIRYAREITQTVVATDSALIELKKVSGEGNDRIQQSFSKSAETAQELGSTITNVINSTADWARLNNTRSLVW